jgi:hypothetical protein
METLKIRKLKWVTTTFVVTLIFFLGIHDARAESEIRSGTTVIVAPGKTVTEYGNAAIQSGGSLNNQGLMVIKANLVNENAAASDLGTGHYEFSGAAAQTISGQNTFGNLTLNNSAGLTILADQRVNGTLTLTSGLVTLGTLGDKNLLLGPAASVEGTPSAAAMIVATGAGEVRKEFAAAGSFTYPVGDNTATAEYSPVTLNFASGTFPAGNFVGVKLEDAAVTDPQITAGTHITRNWTLNNNAAFPIEGFSCTGSFQYLPADVVLMGGSESDLYLLKVSPLVSYNAANTTDHILSGTITSLTSLNTFTGGKAGLQATFKVFLQGPYSAVNHNMNTTLATTLSLGDRADQTKPQNPKTPCKLFKNI